ncbi:unnamed protein product [Rhizoctonia solani]|uniref:Uncharacterized protein n=1 Tax=Rhizoctonia solani TaxID=456999 RepID=A0A8H3B8I4_9AGAM|nr:unnamed protein product [Rhizoctonia solani]
MRRRSQSALARPPPSFFNLGPAKDTALYLSLAEESYVNGFWIALLSRYFPPPRFFIQAESRVNDSSRVDLMVTRLDWINGSTPKYTPMVVFEGKAAKPSPRKESLRDQIRRYAQATTETSDTDSVWCIGAKGHYISFYTYEKYDRGGRMRPVCVDKEGNLKIGKIKDEPRDVQWFDLDKHYGFINGVLEHIVDTPPS